jgi:hypothetical protein
MASPDVTTMRAYPVRHRVPAALIVGTAVCFLLAAAETAQADQFKPAGGGWQTYLNERFGTRLDFPPDVFVPGEAAENGAGRRFAAADATLEVYSFENIERETPASLKRRLVGSEGYTDVTYSPASDSWLVLSGFRGPIIFYEKYFFRGGVVSGFGMEFPADEKPRYAPIIERMEDSFRAGSR